MRRTVPIWAGVLLATTALAADPPASPGGLDGFVTADRLPAPPDPFLAGGRDVWAGTCENCHGGNALTGAPKITSTTAWASRIAGGMDRLVTHATDGFMGPRFTEMPARGGNPDLTDADIAAAVAFMVWASGGAQTAHDFARTYQNKDTEHE